MALNMNIQPENGSDGESTAKDKKPRHRSPNYPGVGLREAVEKVNAIYKEDKLAATPKVAALKHMGYENIHGEAGRVFSALKSFGLVEEIGERVKITQRGINILVRPEGDQQRLEALRQSAVAPGIYRDLLKDYIASGLPSDTALRSELIAVKKFNPNAVDAFIRDFRDSLEFAGISDLSVVDLGEEGDNTSDTKEADPPKTLGLAVQKQTEQGRSLGEALVKVGEKMQSAPILTQTLVVSIPRNFKVDIGVRGDELKKEDLAKIKSQFNRWIEGLEEAFEE